MKTPAEHDRLFARACDGITSTEELTELHRLLRTDPAALDAWLHYSAIQAELAGGTALADVTSRSHADPIAILPTAAPRSLDRITRPWSWFPWAPQAAAGLVLGICAATLVWAYVAPLPWSHTLLDENFEHPEVPLAIRTPLETGIWRGDAAEIVGAQDGVKPGTGASMMRFLRADFDGRTKPTGGHIAVAYRLIDLRPFRTEYSDGGAVVEVAASFNATAFPEAERYGCAISLYALDVGAVPDRPGRLGTTLSNDALAMSRSSRTLLDRNPATWQRLTTEMRVPSDAEFLVVRLHISQAFESAPDFIFTGSYVDDVRVSLIRRSPLP